MKVKCISGSFQDYLIKDKEYVVIKESTYSWMVEDEKGLELYYPKELFKKVLEVEEVELTFKEVIANIKDGEVWESENRIIICKNESIAMKNKNGIKSDCFLFPVEHSFKLKRKEYTFQEAFKAYEEGKEIESISHKYKLINGEHNYFWEEKEEWDASISGIMSFSIKEIQGKWYINE